MVVDVQMTQKSSIYGYHGSQKALFLCVRLRLQSFIAGAKRIFREGFQVQGLGTVTCSTTFESNIPFPLRFMIDTKVYVSLNHYLYYYYYRFREQVGSSYL